MEKTGATPSLERATRCLVLAALGLLAACGGGGGSAGSSANPSPAPPSAPGGNPAPAPTLAFIQVSPGSLALALQGTQQFTAKGTYSDASVKDLTSQVVWTSTVPAVATITAAGLATAVSAGATSIQASLPGNPMVGSAALTVSGPLSPTLQTLTITPPAPTLADGATQQFHAVGAYSDGTTRDLTAQVAWSSFPAGFVAISNSAPTNGLMTTSAGTSGQGIIQASDPATGVAANTTFTLTSAVLSSISVSPGAPDVPAGLAQAFKALGTYSDGSTRDLTTAVTWSSSNPAVASVGNSGASCGLATALVPGTASIQATDPGTGLRGGASLTVAAPLLASLAVGPESPAVASGYTLQLTATGTFTDGSTQDVTSRVAWSSSAPAAASVTSGLVKGLAAGQSLIQASDPATGVHAGTVLSVTAALPVSLAVSPAGPTPFTRSTQPFTATATYSDGSTADVTAQAGWTSSDTTVATVTPGGLAFTLADGSATISASFSGLGAQAKLTCASNTSRVVALAEGSAYSMALKADGTVWTWGNDYSGQLGIGITDATNSSPYPTPWEVGGLSGIAAIAAGDMHSLAVASDGTLWAWGNNYDGELGDGTTNYANTPRKVAGLPPIKAAAAGTFFSLALDTSGNVWAWGLNQKGQLGNGSTTNSSVPIQVPGLSGVVAIAAGSDYAWFAAALKADGTVWAWGANDGGQLGDGSTTDSATPVQVTGLAGVTALSCGGGFTLALKADGSVWAWGYDGDGQTSQPGTVWSGNFFTYTPIQVAGLPKATAIAAGAGHSVALDATGAVWTWGLNANGQLGQGYADTQSIDMHPTPALVPGFGGAAAVAANALTLVLRTDGTVWGWGNNGSGQLGNGKVDAAWPYAEPAPARADSF